LDEKSKNAKQEQQSVTEADFEVAKVKNFCLCGPWHKPSHSQEKEGEEGDGGEEEEEEDYDFEDESVDEDEEKPESIPTFIRDRQKAAKVQAVQVVQVTTTEVAAEAKEEENKA